MPVTTITHVWLHMQRDTRVPIHVDWDSRHIVSLVEFARILNDYIRHSDCTELPPVTVGLILANLIVFLKPGELSIAIYLDAQSCRQMHTCKCKPFADVHQTWCLHLVNVIAVY